MASTGKEIGDTGAKSLSDALKSNTTLTQLSLSCQHERSNKQTTSINNPLFPFLNSTGSNIEKGGATSLSDALKSNTTLAKLNLTREDKRNNPHLISIDKPLFSILFKSTENIIGSAGATSLSDALKANIALTELDLSCEHKRNNTQMASVNNPLFPILIKPKGNNIGKKGATSLGNALKSNTTLAKLNLGREHKRNNTQMASINNPLFFILIRSTGNKIGDKGATSLSDALKSNTTLMELDLRCGYKRNNTNNSINQQSPLSLSWPLQAASLEKEVQNQ